MRATLRWASGRSPRNVTFQSARPPDKATGRRDKVLELLLFKNLRTSRNFQQLQLFSIKSTTRWNYWDEWHVEMVIRPGSLNFYFSTGSAAGLRDDVCLLYTDYIACFCEVIFVRDNVFIMFPWFKWILHLNLSTKVNFLVWKSARFATKISVYWVPYKAIYLLWKRSFHQDCLQTKLAIMWKMFPCERSFSNWKWSNSSTSPPSIFVKTKNGPMTSHFLSLNIDHFI